MRFRSLNSGFTLLEAMVSFALLSMILGSVFTVSSQSLKQQIEATVVLDQSAMGRALLEEYVTTYPAMETSGTYKNAWQWQISESPQKVLQETDFDRFFEFVKVTATVRTLRTASEKPFEISTVVAKRAPDL